MLVVSVIVVVLAVRSNAICGRGVDDRCQMNCCLVKQLVYRLDFILWEGQQVDTERKAKEANFFFVFTPHSTRHIVGGEKMFERDEASRGLVYRRLKDVERNFPLEVVIALMRQWEDVVVPQFGGVDLRGWWICIRR